MSKQKLLVILLVILLVSILGVYILISLKKSKESFIKNTNVCKPLGCYKNLKGKLLSIHQIPMDIKGSKYIYVPKPEQENVENLITGFFSQNPNDPLKIPLKIQGHNDMTISRDMPFYGTIERVHKDIGYYIDSENSIIPIKSLPVNIKFSKYLTMENTPYKKRIVGTVTNEKIPFDTDSSENITIDDVFTGFIDKVRL